MRTLEIKDRKIFINDVEADVTLAHQIVTNEHDGITILNMIIADIMKKLDEQFSLNDDEKNVFSATLAQKIL